MTWKQIETSREARLWVVQVLIPIAAITTGILSVPEIRKAASTKINNVKNILKTNLKEIESNWLCELNIAFSFFAKNTSYIMKGVI